MNRTIPRSLLITSDPRRRYFKIRWTDGRHMQDQNEINEMNFLINENLFRLGQLLHEMSSLRFCQTHKKLLAIACNPKRMKYSTERANGKYFLPLAGWKH